MAGNGRFHTVGTTAPDWRSPTLVVDRSAHAPPSPMTGGEAVVGALRVHDVTHVFGIPATHTLGIYRALGLADDIQHITTTHEQGAAFMADGYARAGGRPGVCCVTTGPGLANAATALAQAYSDSIPVLCITSHIPSIDIGRNRGHSHELRSQEKVIEGVTDRSWLVRSPAEIPSAITEAFGSFGSQRARPAVVVVPVDVQDDSEPTVFLPPIKNEARVPAASAVEEAAKMLSASSSPALVVGGGTQNAADKVVELAIRLDAPVVTTLNGKGVMPGDHPLATSVAGYEAIGRFLATCDCVLAIGTELSPADLWTIPLELHGKLIQIDLDDNQIGVNHPVDHAVIGDAGVAMEMLLEALPPAASRSGTSRAGAVRESAIAEALLFGEPYRPWIEALRKAMPTESALVLDIAMVAGAAFPIYDTVAPSAWIHPTGLGTLGYALPAAIGAKIAAPDRQVAALAGDGGFMFTMSELSVAVQHSLTIPIILWNNRGYGEIRRLMEERGDQPYASDLRTPDIATLATAFGAQSEVVREPVALIDAVGRAFEADGPTLIEIPDWT